MNTLAQQFVTYLNLEGGRADHPRPFGVTSVAVAEDYNHAPFPETRLSIVFSDGSCADVYSEGGYDSRVHFYAELVDNPIA